MAGIYGLSGSGLDIDQLVKDSMKAKRIKYDTVKQKATQLEWRKTDYNTIYKTVSDYRSNSVFNFTLQSGTQPKKTTSSNEAVATITANGDAANVSHSLTVNQLATGVTETSTGTITTGALKDTLAQQFSLTAVTSPNNISTFDVLINGKTITVDPTKSLNQMVSDINNAGAGVKANYDVNLDKFFIYATDTGSAAGIDFTGSSAAGMNFVMGNLKLNTIASNVSTTGATSLSSLGVADAAVGTLNTQFPGLTGTFNLKINNGTTTNTIAVDTTTMSLDQLVSAVNGAGVNATAAYDPATGFTLKATSGTLNFTGSDSEAMDFLTNNLKLSQTKQTGQDAKIVLDGSSITQSKNDFSVSGVKYSLKATGSATVGVLADIDKTIASVQSFIDSYNATLLKLNTKVEEPVYKGFLPLSDDQKAAMNDSDIKAWEAKAKSGLLHNDSILTNIINKMRSDVSAPVVGVTGIYNSLASIGISTTNWEEKGLLHLDESKLRKALEGDPTKGLSADPDIVNKLFTKKSTSEDKSIAYGETGIANRLYDSLKTATDNIKTQAGVTASTTTDTQSNLAKQMLAYTKQLNDMSRRLVTTETNLYKRYNALENALAKLTKQSSWLAQQG